MKRLFLLASIVCLLSPSLYASELELFCQYAGEHSGEQMQLKVTDNNLLWTEALPDHGVNKSTYERIHSRYGVNRYTGKSKDGQSYFTIEKKGKSKWLFTIAMLHRDGSLYMGANDHLICIES